MGLLETPQMPHLIDAPQPEVVCRCGHCRMVLEVSDRQRRVRCSSCGWLNAVPIRTHVVCERCHHTQSVRFRDRNSQLLCANCGYTLHIREIELRGLCRRVYRKPRHRMHSSRRDSVVLTILVYALVLIFFLLWFIRQ